jgi:ribosome biogenesis protein Nip4
MYRYNVSYVDDNEHYSFLYMFPAVYKTTRISTDTHKYIFVFRKKKENKTHATSVVNSCWLLYVLCC